MLPRRLTALGIACSLLAANTTARAGAPFETDDPNITDVGRVELLLFYQNTLDGSGRSGSAPGLEIHFGVINGLELDIVPVLAFDTPSGGNTRWGYGDTKVEIKYRIVEESERLPLVSLVPQVYLPTGNSDRGLGNGASEVFLGLAAQKTFGAFQTYANAGYWIINGAGNRNYWFAGWVGQYSVSDKWILGGEIFWTTGQAPGQSSSVGFNLGGYYQLDARTQLMFSAGRGIKNASETNRVSTYAGVLVGF